MVYVLLRAGRVQQPGRVARGRGCPGAQQGEQRSTDRQARAFCCSYFSSKSVSWQGQQLSGVPRHAALDAAWAFIDSCTKLSFALLGWSTGTTSARVSEAKGGQDTGQAIKHFKTHPAHLSSSLKQVTGFFCEPQLPPPPEAPHQLSFSRAQPPRSTWGSRQPGPTPTADAIESFALTFAGLHRTAPEICFKITCLCFPRPKVTRREKPVVLSREIMVSKRRGQHVNEPLSYCHILTEARRWWRKMN